MPPFFFVFSFLEQEVAAGVSKAFAGCSGLADILNGLEGRPPPTKKPQAIKRKFAASKKAAAPKAKAKAAPAAALESKAKAEAAPAAAPKSKALAAPAPKSKAKAAPVFVETADSAFATAASVPPAGVLKDTRKCVHSRAYKAAVKACQHEIGWSKQDVSKFACKKAQEAAEQWDRDGSPEIL